MTNLVVIDRDRLEERLGNVDAAARQAPDKVEDEIRDITAEITRLPDRHNIDGELFRKRRDAAEDAARGEDMAGVVRELVWHVENGETLTTRNAKILGIAYDLKRRVD